MTDRMTRVAQADHLLEKVTAANVDREPVADRLERDWADLKQLIIYYQTEWLGDMEALPDAQFGVLSEDGVWNEMGSFFDTVGQIHEVSARILAEYENLGAE